MKIDRLIIISLIIISFCGKSQAKDKINDFDISLFYKTLSSDSLDLLNKQLSILENNTIDKREAYEGTLLMKKAGLVKNAIEKLKLFKAGRVKLEAAILKDSMNIEFHFLRLIIQENAPGIVNYRNDLKNDDQKIRIGFRKLSPDVQKAVMDYRKRSKFLKEIVN